MKKPGPRLGGPDLKSVNRFSAAATQDQAKEAQPEQRGSGRLRNCRILNLQPVPGIEPSLRLVSSGDHSCGVGDDPGRVPVEFGVVGKRVAKDCERRFVNRSRSGLGLPKQDQVIEPARCQSRNLLSDAGAGGRGACRPSAIIKDKMIRAQRLTRAVKRVHNLSIGKRGAARVVTKADGGRISVSVGHVRNACVAFWAIGKLFAKAKLFQAPVWPEKICPAMLIPLPAFTSPLWVFTLPASSKSRLMRAASDADVAANEAAAARIRVVFVRMLGSIGLFFCSVLSARRLSRAAVRFLAN